MTVAKDTGGAAFPVIGQKLTDAEGRVLDPYVGYGWLVDPQPGATLRDYFAAKAMAAMISTAASPCLLGLEGVEFYTARAAYNIADAMLQVRNT